MAPGARRGIATAEMATHAAAQQRRRLKESSLLTLDDLARQAHFAAERLLDRALDAMRERVSDNGKLSAGKN